MDQYVKDVKDLYRQCGGKGDLYSFRSSARLIKYCISEGLIANVKRPQELNQDMFEAYYSHLVDLVSKYLRAHPEITTWKDFANRKTNMKAQKIIHEFGVRGILFGDEDKSKVEEPVRSKRLTLEEFYELCQIKFNFKGGFPSFKRHIQRTYGSFAEYCILKGYDINSTNWESDETALRCASLLGDLDSIKTRSLSLYKYLESKGLLGSIQFKRKVS